MRLPSFLLFKFLNKTSDAKIQNPVLVTYINFFVGTCDVLVGTTYWLGRIGWDLCRIFPLFGTSNAKPL